MKSMKILLDRLAPRGPAILWFFLALGLAFLVTRVQFDSIESVLYDARMRLRPAPSTSGNIVTIVIDPSSVARMHRAPNAFDHARVLSKIAARKPKSVVFLVHPADLLGSYDELSAFSRMAGSIPNFFVGVDDAPMKGTEEAFRLAAPFNNIALGTLPSTIDRNIFARDSVTRRMFISYRGQPFLHAQLAALFNPDLRRAHPVDGPGSPASVTVNGLPQVDERRIQGAFEFLESQQAYINFRPARSYPRIRFIDAMSGDFDGEDITGKLVLIGRDIETTSKDYIRTPYSREVNAMALVEMHANILDTLIVNNAFIQLPEWVNFLLTALAAVLTVYVVLAMKPSRGLLALIGAMAFFCIACILLFWWANVWVLMASPLLTAFVCYYLFIPYRLIMENRRSWEYYQKNKLLVQVEELKTNFLSMMSHDLKTPIARIQGMAEVVLNDVNSLSDRQREALRTLHSSSEELLEFVSSILNLGRIESKELKLHLHSKDPNHLLHEVIEKSRYLAASKNITVTAELEPMFSIKMDVDLMRQVFSNLIENAFKYSPPGTRVLVSSEEADGKVIIQFADQGMGIPDDEIGHVFSKFYRSKTAKTSNIKGSGLGLYLAKYFVELHKGAIFVDSTPGQGSTFTVVLPTDSGDDRKVAREST